MTTAAKRTRTGLEARSSSIRAAMEASGEQAPSSNGSAKEESTAPQDKLIGLSVRLTRERHDALRRISYEQRIPIHTIILQGLDYMIGKNPPKQ